jgi:hypothetical protein
MCFYLIFIYAYLFIFGIQLISFRRSIAYSTNQVGHIILKGQCHEMVIEMIP